MVGLNLKHFHADLEKFREVLGITKATLFRKLTLDIWNGITLRTPVDTGRARSSWNVAVGQPNPASPAAAAAIPAPLPPELDGITGEEPIFITSNLEYIEPLEQGHSKQAPAGMVMVTIAEVQARIELTLEAYLKQNTP